MSEISVAPNLGDKSMALAVRTRVVILSTSAGRACGIGQHSLHAERELGAAGYTVDVLTDVDEVVALSESLNGAVHILVQHEYGLFDYISAELVRSNNATLYVFGRLARLRSQYSEAMKITIMLHTPPARGSIYFETFTLLRSYGFEIVTFSKLAAERFQLKQTDNGVPNIAFQPAPRTPRIRKAGLFGFFSETRVTRPLLEVCKQLDLELICQMSVRPERQPEMDKLLDQMRAMGLRARVYTDYADDDAVIERMKDCDIFISVFSQYAHYGTTGSARFLMNFGRPIIANPVRHSNDLKDTILLRPFSDIADELVRLQNRAYYQACCERVVAYREEHTVGRSFERVIRDRAVIPTTDEPGWDYDALFKARGAPTEAERSALEPGKPDGPADAPPTIVASGSGEGGETGQVGVLAPSPIRYTSDEFRARHAALLPPGAFVVDLYRQLLKREPDWDGFDQYVNLLSEEGDTPRRRTDLVLSFRWSDEGKYWPVDLGCSEDELLEVFQKGDALRPVIFRKLSRLEKSRARSVSVFGMAGRSLGELIGAFENVTLDAFKSDQSLTSLDHRALREQSPNWSDLAELMVDLMDEGGLLKRQDCLVTMFSWTDAAASIRVNNVLRDLIGKTLAETLLNFSRRCLGRDLFQAEHALLLSKSASQTSSAGFEPVREYFNERMAKEGSPSRIHSRDELFQSDVDRIADLADKRFSVNADLFERQVEKIELFNEYAIFRERAIELS